MNDESKEPALATGSVGTFLAAVYVIINEIWPNLLSDKIQEAITTVVVIFLPLIIGIIIRQKVWSPASVSYLQTRLDVLERQQKTEGKKLSDG